MLFHLKIKSRLEKYLIETNKKVLIISKKQPVFKNKFLFRQETVDKSFFTYFNNDIQYGSKYILKRSTIMRYVIKLQKK